MANSLYDFCIEQDAFELLVQWDKQRNGTLTPRDVTKGSHRKIWWRCSHGHSWQAVVYTRTGQHSGCPYCTGRLFLPSSGTLADECPELVKEWHPSKNADVTPCDVVPGTNQRVWWQCEKGHEWQATVMSRTSMGTGCPICAGKVVIPGINDLASQRPFIAAQWHPEKNGALRPDQVTTFSNRKVWWLCDKGHEYYASIAHRAQSATGCPYCSNRKVLPGFNDLAAIEPKVAAQWLAELNAPLTPQMVTIGSRKKVWWQCSEGHIWKAVVFSRAGPQKTGCPVCSGKVKESRQIRYADVLAEKLKTNSS